MFVFNIVIIIKYAMNIHRVKSFRILIYIVGLILYQVKIKISFPTSLYKYRIKQKLYVYK